MTFDASVFPNPTETGDINLRLTSGDQSSDVSIAIYNVEGRVFYEEIFSAQDMRTSLKLDLAQTLSSGMYLVQIRQAGQQKQLRMMIR